ncbi:hypothetical protein [Mycolicibacterium sp. XJ1819]
MTHSLRRGFAAATLAVAMSLAALPAVTITAVAQPGNCCCPPGQTGVIYGCAPFCIEGKYLDSNTGLCTPLAAPAPPQQ